MNLTRGTFFAAALAAAFPVTAAHAATVSSTFDADAEGWTTVGDVGSTVTAAGGAAQLNESAAGVTDFFVAPSKFLGDLAAYYGGTISFDLQTSGVAMVDTTDGDVILTGPGGSLFGFLTNTPIANTSVSNSLAFDPATPWHFNAANGAAATAAQIQSVLANVTSLRIRGDYVGGPDVTTLDNVVLASAATAIPLPAAFPAGLAFLAALPLAKRLRRRT
jgi:hypothetical protein